MIYSLIGVDGCGKNAVGKALSTLLGIDFIDTRFYKADKQGKLFGQTAESNGKTGFSSNELSQIPELYKSDDLILSCGDAIWIESANIGIIAERTTPIWIKKSLKIILQDPNILNSPPFYGDRVLFLDHCCVNYPMYKKIAKAVFEETDNKRFVEYIEKYIKNTKV